MHRKMPRIRSSLTVLLALVAAFAGSSAEAQLRIEITSGVERPLPIAIVPFGWQGSGPTAPFDLAAVVTADLGNSGRFAPLDEPATSSRGRPSPPKSTSKTGDLLDVDHAADRRA